MNLEIETERLASGKYRVHRSGGLGGFKVHKTATCNHHKEKTEG